MKDLHNILMNMPSRAMLYNVSGFGASTQICIHTDMHTVGTYPYTQVCTVYVV